MSPKRKAILLMLTAGFSFAMMAVSVKFASGVSLPVKVMARNIIAIFVTLALLKQSHAPVFGQRKHLKYLVARAVFGTTAMALYFWSIMKINVADATMLNNLSPFAVTIFAFFLLKEKLSKLQVPALFVVFFASLLIIKPKFDISIIPAMAGATSALLSGAAYTVVRYLSDKENPATIVFFFSFVSTILVLPFAIVDFQVPAMADVWALVGIGVFASGGQMSITYAYKFAKASEISLLVYANVLFTVLLGWIFWSEIPDKYSIIGGLTIIVVSAILFLYNRKHATTISEDINNKQITQGLD